MNTIDESIFDLSLLEELPSTDNYQQDQYNQVEQFCTPDSLSASTNYINILLTSYGYPVPVVLDSTDTVEKCKIVNCIYKLLNDKKNDEREREEYIQEINKLNKERENLETQLSNTKRDLQQKDRQYVEIKSKLEANESNYKKQSTENARLKEEISKLKHNMQYIKAQYAHETKRHEQELTKTQDRLVKQMNNHFKVNVGQLNMNSLFQTTVNNTAEQDQLIQIKSMYTDLLSKSNNKEREARQESEELRLSLIKLYTDARRMLEAQIHRFNKIQPKEPRDAYKEAARFRLPMDCGGRESFKYIEELLNNIKQEWDYQISHQPKEYTKEEMQEKLDMISELEESVQDLLEEIEQAKSGYQEKTKIYKRFEQGGFFDTLYPTADAAYVPSDSEDSVDDLINDELSKFKFIKSKVMKDQRKITEAAIELGQQRANLEAERWAFNEMRRELKLQELLSDASTPQPAKTVIDVDRPRKRLRPFLGAPSNS